MFKIDNIGAVDITNLQNCLCCNSTGSGGTSKYNGTGFFGPGFTGTNITINQAIDLLRRPNTYYPLQFGYNNTGAAHESAVILANYDDNSPNNSENCIAIGHSAGQYDQSENSIAIGLNAGIIRQGSDSVAIGPSAGNVDQGDTTIAIGKAAAYSTQGEYSIALGYLAANVYQGTRSVAIGSETSSINQGNDCISIGTNAGHSEQGIQSIAIGKNSGYTGQGSNCIAIGCFAGYTTQATNSIAIGNYSAQNNQGMNSVAIGHEAGLNYQGQNCIAIGNGAGMTSQGNYSIAIGYLTSTSSQPINSITISAKDTGLDNMVANSCVIAPIRNVNGSSTTHLFYDNATGELTWGTETPSSNRYKENIIPITESNIEKILKLQPVEFDFKNNGKHSFGFIAENVDTVLPQIVQTHPDTGLIESIDYYQLIAPLLKLVQQHEEKLQSILAFHKD